MILKTYEKLRNTCWDKSVITIYNGGCIEIHIEMIGFFSAKLDISIDALSRIGQLAVCLSAINAGTHAVSGRTIYRNNTY